MERDGKEWKGMQRKEYERKKGRKGMGRNVKEWEGMERNGKEWSGMVKNEEECKRMEMN